MTARSSFIRPAVTSDLRLTRVHVATLPRELGTDHEPATYTVEAQFSRRPAPAEVDAVLHVGARRFLAARGFPHAVLGVTDRRLVIQHTSLAELHDGLAAAIAELLVAISTDVRQRVNERPVVDPDAAEAEQRRVDDVETAAAEVRFESSAGDRDGAVEEWVELLRSSFGSDEPMPGEAQRDPGLSS